MAAPKRPDLAAAAAAYAKTPHPESAAAFLHAAAPVLSRAVRAYAGADSPAVRAKAKQIALDAGLKFDPSRGVKPETFLLGHLQSLRRYGAALAAPVRLGDRLRADVVLVDRHAGDLRDALGREPSDAEVADRAGVPVERVARARGVPAAFVESAAPEGLTGAVPSGASEARKAWVAHLYHDLDPVSQVILERSTGLNGHPVLSTTEIAKLVGRTPGAVSQRKARIDQMLSEYAQLFGSR